MMIESPFGKLLEFNHRTSVVGAITPAEPGLTGMIETSIAYALPDAQTAAAIFAGESEGFAYSRFGLGTPPIQALSEKLLDLEVGESNPRRLEFGVLLTASGMSAITLLALALGENGGEFISSPRLYGGTYHLFEDFLPRLGINGHFICDPLNLDDWDNAAKQHPQARFLFAEDDANPTPIKLNNEAIALIAHKYGLLYICDRTVSTCTLERPLLHGTDIIIHSLSKNIGGFSFALGGAIIGPKALIKAIRDSWFVVTGPVLDARAADRILFGAQSLTERMKIKLATTKKVVAFLKSHPRVVKVYGPGADLLAFELKGNLKDAKKLVESFEQIIFAPHLGHFKTLAIHPASTTHAKVPQKERLKLGITDTLIRLSIGLEEPQLIIDDLAKAFQALAQINDPNGSEERWENEGGSNLADSSGPGSPMGR